MATLNYVPVYWKSSVIQCYANENFDEDHPDRSSGASETRGAGNATMNILHLSYIAREAGIQFPKPFVLQEGGMYLAMLAMKDMKWNKALAGDDATSGISSFHDEHESLLSTVLTLVEKDDPGYDELRRMAVRPLQTA